MPARKLSGGSVGPTAELEGSHCTQKGKITTRMPCFAMNVCSGMAHTIQRMFAMQAQASEIYAMFGQIELLRCCTLYFRYLIVWQNNTTINRSRKNQDTTMSERKTESKAVYDCQSQGQLLKVHKKMYIRNDSLPCIMRWSCPRREAPSLDMAIPTEGLLKERSSYILESIMNTQKKFIARTMDLHNSTQRLKLYKPWS